MMKCLQKPLGKVMKRKVDIKILLPRAGVELRYSAPQLAVEPKERLCRLAAVLLKLFIIITVKVSEELSRHDDGDLIPLKPTGGQDKDTQWNEIS